MIVKVLWKKSLASFLVWICKYLEISLLYVTSYSIALYIMYVNYSVVHIATLALLGLKELFMGNVLYQREVCKTSECSLFVKVSHNPIAGT